MKRKALLIPLVLLLAMSVVACAAPTPEPAPAPSPSPSPAPAPAPAEEPEEFTVIHSDMSTAESTWSKWGIQPWRDYVQAVGGDRVTVEFYPGGALHGWGDAYTALQSGITDMCQLWTGAMPGVFPLIEVFHLPALVPASWATNNAIITDTYDRWPVFWEQYDEKVVNIFNTIHMMSDIHSVKPIRTLDDLKGKVIACTNEQGAEAMNALGASGTVMMGSDAYLAAERGVIDGILAAWGWVEIFNLQDVTPYHYMLRISPGTVSWAMNRETFEKFTPKEQWELKQYRYQGLFNTNRGAIYSADDVIATIPPESLIWPTEEDEAKKIEVFRPSWEKWADNVEEMGYPGHDILNDILYLKKIYTDN